VKSPPAGLFQACVLHEDDHLLVVHKPAGWNTHAPSPFAGEGIYDWLRAREPRWASLAIIHRLDKDTSGVMVFGKSPLANQSLTRQFERREVAKKYLLLTDRPPLRDSVVVKSCVVKDGNRHVSRPARPGDALAETSFRVVQRRAETTLIEAQPGTGRTHQVRIHAADAGFPILGDESHGGTAAHRVCLHAESIAFAHPSSGETVTFRAEADFKSAPHLALRSAVCDVRETDAFRLIHGASDGFTGWFVDKLGDFLVSASEGPLEPDRRARLHLLLRETGARGAYHKRLLKKVATPADAAPQWVAGDAAAEIFDVRENGLRFGLSFIEGYSPGLFLDQRDNRRRLQTGHIAAGFDIGAGSTARRVLNTFAYTCAFSASAATGGARVTSVDLSKKYLEWGRRNFALNGLDASAHEFLHGDCFDWMRRLAKKGRAFDVVLLDPPTFSRSKSAGVFAAKQDYASLVTLALPLLAPGGVLFASTNAASLAPEGFLGAVRGAVARARRSIVSEHYAPQPPDFPITRGLPAHLKTVWMKIQ